MPSLIVTLSNFIADSIIGFIVKWKIVSAVQHDKLLNENWDKGFAQGVKLGMESGVQLGIQIANQQAAAIAKQKPQLPDSPRWDSFRDDED